MSNPAHRPTHFARARRPALLAGALLIAASLVLVAAPGADAGIYRALQCHERSGAGQGAASYSANSARYVRAADCRGAGLGITHEPGRKATTAGQFGAWTIKAPTGTRMIRARARVKAQGGGWHAPQMLVALAGGARKMLQGVRGERHPVAWAGAAGRALIARLICSRRRCGKGPGALVSLRAIALTLSDTRRPAVEPGGSLLAGGSRRGGEVLRVGASDAGSGVRTITVELNGDPIAARVPECALDRRVATRLRPCPAETSARFDIATATPQFRQGHNQLRICAADYAAGAHANRTCERRTVRIDNLCPLSEKPGVRLRARFRGAGQRLRTRSDRPVFITGALVDARGTPVAGATVCVAARPLNPGSRERVLMTPATNASGRFTARVPAGPSRAIRIAHWPNEDRALERRLHVRARAVPRLQLRPSRALRNGERLRFRVRLPGPANARRRVAVEARAGGRWVRIAGGRTSRRGVWFGGYRFRATTGTRRYAFRAIVRRQHGYPYARGRSAIRHAKVIGR